MNYLEFKEEYGNGMMDLFFAGDNTKASDEAIAKLDALRDAHPDHFKMFIELAKTMGKIL